MKSAGKDELFTSRFYAFFSSSDIAFIWAWVCRYIIFFRIDLPFKPNSTAQDIHKQLYLQQNNSIDCYALSLYHLFKEIYLQQKPKSV